MEDHNKVYGNRETKFDSNFLKHTVNLMIKLKFIDKLLIKF